MLIKINSRGKGGSDGPINYLLGKDRKRDKALVLRGDVEQTADLIDSCNFSRNYTSGCLSFEENNIPEHQKRLLMNEFEKMVFAGLDHDQYDCLWIEHRDKDRLELNFLIPNVELQTGKRLQPYYDKVDRDYFDNWKQTVNDRFGFSDPNDPANKRFSVTSYDLPRDKKKAVELITQFLVNGVNQGLIKSRDDVIQELKSNGFEIARETKGSISIKDPEGGKNIRLKGALYERDFKFSEETRAEIERTNTEYRNNTKQRLENARESFRKAYQAKHKYNSERYKRTEQAEQKSYEASVSSSITHIHDRVNHRRSFNSGLTLRSTEVKPNKLIERIKNNVRSKSTIRTSIETVIKAVRTAVRRSARANERTSRADNFANRFKAKQFKERKQFNARLSRNANARAKEFTMRPM
jgi:hypothetical protein